MFIRNNFRTISILFILIGVLLIVYLYQSTKQWTFNRIVIVVALCFLLGMLVLVGYLVNNSKYNAKWPPVIGECPDYWEVEKGEDGKYRCIVNERNTNVGRCNQASYNTFISGLSENDLKGISGLRKKSKWANDCGIMWDGVTNHPDVINHSIHT